MSETIVEKQYFKSPSGLPRMSANYYEKDENGVKRLMNSQASGVRSKSETAIDESEYKSLLSSRIDGIKEKQEAHRKKKEQDLAEIFEAFAKLGLTEDQIKLVLK